VGTLVEVSIMRPGASLPEEDRNSAEDNPISADYKLPEGVVGAAPVGAVAEVVQGVAAGVVQGAVADTWEEVAGVVQGAVAEV
jgi:hypothetical protein